MAVVEAFTRGIIKNRQEIGEHEKEEISFETAITLPDKVEDFHLFRF